MVLRPQFVRRLRCSPWLRRYSRDQGTGTGCDHPGHVWSDRMWSSTGRLLDGLFSLIIYYLIIGVYRQLLSNYCFIQILFRFYSGPSVNNNTHIYFLLSQYFTDAWVTSKELRYYYFCYIYHYVCHNITIIAEQLKHLLQILHLVVIGKLL